LEAILLNHLRRKTSMAILLLLLIPFVVRAIQVETVQVNPLLDQKLLFDLDSGLILTGSFSVEGGNNDINFKVTDLVGNTIIDLGRVTGRTSFEFITNRNGNYAMIFDNSFSTLASKTITMSYDIRYTFLGVDLLDLLLIITVILVVCFALAGVLYFWSRKNR
jgi:hypothetical protein